MPHVLADRESSLIWKPAILTWDGKDKLSLGILIRYHFFPLKLYVNQGISCKYSTSSLLNRCPFSPMFGETGFQSGWSAGAPPWAPHCIELSLTFLHGLLLKVRSVQPLPSRVGMGSAACYSCLSFPSFPFPVSMRFPLLSSWAPTEPYELFTYRNMTPACTENSAHLHFSLIVLPQTSQCVISYEWLVTPVSCCAREEGREKAIICKRVNSAK